MLLHDLAHHFSRAVPEKETRQLHRVQDEYHGPGVVSLRRLVGMQQSGVQELIGSRLQ